MIVDFAIEYKTLSNSIKELYMEYSGIDEERLLKLVCQYKEEYEKEVANAISSQRE